MIKYKYLLYLNFFILSSCYYGYEKISHVYISSNAIVVKKIDVNNIRRGVSLDVTLLPLEYQLKRNNYTIFIRTPNQFSGGLYIELKIKNNYTNKNLELKSTMFDFVHNDQSWPYTYFIKKHIDNRMLNFEVVDSIGKNIDTITLNYEVKDIGKIKVVDAL